MTQILVTKGRVPEEDFLDLHGVQFVINIVVGTHVCCSDDTIEGIYIENCSVDVERARFLSWWMEGGITRNVF